MPRQKQPCRAAAAYIYPNTRCSACFHCPGAVGSLGDLDAPLTAPLVPFALRWLRADLPARLDMVADTIDALYRLLQYCKAQLHTGEP